MKAVVYEIQITLISLHSILFLNAIIISLKYSIAM